MCIRRLKRWAPMTTPSVPAGTSSESFFTSSPARPKIACSSFSSGESSVFTFGATVLGLADFDIELFDVNRSERIGLHELFADDDGVFEVVAVVGHERDEH